MRYEVHTNPRMFSCDAHAIAYSWRKALEAAQDLWYKKRIENIL